MMPTRSTLHAMLLGTCAAETMDSPEWRTLERVIERACRWNQPTVSFVPERIWIAFYRREPMAMLMSRRDNVRQLGQQFKAHEDAAAACQAMDAILTPRTGPEDPPGSAAGR